MENKKLLLPAICLALLSSALMFPARGYASENDVEREIEVYVLSLDDVGASEVNNMSRVIEGVVRASRVDEIHYWTGEWKAVGSAYEPVLGEVELDVRVIPITSWEAYRILVEFGNGVIIVNAHGEVVPTPSGYATEEWIDKIAYAMAHRNVTWVHMAGYPFCYYDHQELGEGTWGEEGFKQLTSHIGKNNVTCWAPGPPGSEMDKVDMNPTSRQELVWDWGEALAYAAYVDSGWPIKKSDFEDVFVLPIFGGGDYCTGAVIKFAESSETSGFGFYVHIGTRQTYDEAGVPTDKDYWRGYSGTAAAIWATQMKATSENAIFNAETAIANAEKEGRTKGLDEAIVQLQQAKEAYVLCEFIGSKGAIGLANKVEMTANETTKLSFIEAYSPHVMVLGIAAVVIIGGLAIRWRNNKHKNFNQTQTRLSG